MRGNSHVQFLGGPSFRKEEGPPTQGRRTRARERQASAGRAARRRSGGLSAKIPPAARCASAVRPILPFRPGTRRPRPGFIELLRFGPTRFPYISRF
jgi:hypothetical protein